MTEPVLDVAAFDAMPATAAVDLLRPVCASGRWRDAVVAARPYSTLDALDKASDDLVEHLGWTDVLEAMAAHPRIGERAAGQNRESQWSRQEQSTASGASDDITTALHDGNLDYEERFGHVFLVCATGRTPLQILEALTERLDNDERTEQDVVRRELAAIVRLRLAKVLR